MKWCSVCVLRVVFKWADLINNVGWTPNIHRLSHTGSCMHILESVEKRLRLRQTSVFFLSSISAYHLTSTLIIDPSLPLQQLFCFAPAIIMSRDMTNTIILEPLRLLKKDRDTLSKSTQAVVRQNREKNALSMNDADFVRGLAKQWLQGNGEKYLNTNQSRLLWPKDTERLTEIIADLMSLQNLRRAKEDRSPRSVRQHEVKDLKTWPQPRSKRLCTQQGKSSLLI